MNRILVTGTTSGFGKFLAEKYLLECDVFNRGDLIPERHYDIIIHCAYDKKDDFNNYKLTKRILGIPHTTFVYISSVDAYNPDQSLYATVKANCEEQVKEYANEFLIVRLGALVGEYMRENNVTRMFSNDSLTLTSDSSFALISYERAYQEIDNLIVSGKTGTFDIAGPIKTLKEIAEEYGLSPYGKYTYSTYSEIIPIAEDKELTNHLLKLKEKYEKKEGEG